MKLRTPETKRSKLWTSLMVVLVLGLCASALQAQSSTTTARTPGTPGGSYQLGDADTINLFTGNLNYSLPLLTAVGRGEAQAGLGIVIEGQWDMTPSETLPPNPSQEHNYNFRGPNGPALVGAVRLNIAFQNTGQSCGGNGSNEVQFRMGIVYVEPDGTEHALRDTFVHGLPFNICGFASQPLGRVFESGSGDFVTYVNDTAIYSNCLGISGCTNNVDGYLYFRNGTKSRVVGEQILWTQDRNGNKTDYTYETQQYSKRLLQITDSIGRAIYIDYNVDDPQPYGLCTRLRFKGFGGTDKIIRISQENDLGAVLRTTQPSDPTEPVQIVYDDPKDDVHITYGLLPGSFIRAVWLPDGRSYQFKYNVLAQLARVELPTGGALEYDYVDTANLPFEGPPNQGGVPTITNSVTEKRVYDTNSVLLSRTVFSSPTDYTQGVIPPSRPGVVRDVELFEPDGTRLAKSRHYFYGSPDADYGLGVPWWHGKEFRVESFDLNGSTMLRVGENTWSQRIPSWCTFWPCYSNPAELAPTNNPFIAETKTTVVDGNLVSKTSGINPSNQSLAFDIYNDQTDVWQYGYGSGQPGPLLKHVHSTYISNANPLFGSIYILGLRATTDVYSVAAGGAETLTSSSQTLYDEYTQYPLYTYTTVAGWQDPGASRGNPTTVKRWLNTDGSWVETHARFDQLGNVRKSWDALGRPSEVVYSDAFTDTPAVHNAFAFPTQTISAVADASNAHGANTAFSSTVIYDYYSGLVTSSTDANSQTTTLEYQNDPLDRLKKITNPPGGGWTSFEYGDTVGNLFVKNTTALDNTRNVETYTKFDGLARSVRVFSPKAGGLWTIADTQYDAAGRVIQISKPYLDASLTAAVNPTNNWVSTAYDALGRITKVKTADGSEAHTTYDANTVTATDADSKKRKTEIDALGRITQIIEDPDGASLITNYKYDILGNLRQVEQGSQRRYYKYDSLSRLTRSRNPEQLTNPDLAVNDPIAENDQWSTAIDYLANGDVSAKTDARGIRIDYLYDNLSRLYHRTYTATRTLPTGTYTALPAVDSYYDGRGLPAVPSNSLTRLSRVSSSVSEMRYTGFDAMGRLTSTEQITDGQTYQMPSNIYNLSGSLTSQTYPSGRVVQSSFDDAGNLATVTGQAPNQSAKTYASNFDYTLTGTGATSRVLLGNGRWESTVYNKRLQPTLIGLGTTQNGTELMKLEYGYGTTNNNGNLRSQTITVPTVGGSAGFSAVQNYGYDDLNRLTTAVETTAAQTNWQETFTYDQFGNRSVVTGSTTPALVGDNPQIAAGTTTNRITSRAGEFYQYDATGNLTTDRVGNSYSFDGENSQSTFSNIGGAQSSGAYFYDGEGRRIKKVVGSETTVFVYNATGQTVAEYALNPQQVANPTTYLTADNLNTPRVSTGQSGGVLTRHDYLPYGEELTGYGGRGSHAEYAADSVRQKYTGLERDTESGLDYAQARYYASKAGRFTSVDPLMASANTSCPQTFNRYVYALNNPLRYVDRSGMEGSDEVDAAFIQLAALIDRAEEERAAQEEAEKEARRKQQKQQQTTQQTTPANAQQGQAPSQAPATGYGRIHSEVAEGQRRTAVVSCPIYDPFIELIQIGSEDIGVESDVTTATIVYSPVNRGKELGDQQPMFGKSDGDDRGHIIGRALGGPPTPENLFSQDPKVNQNSYKTFETKIREKLTAHQDWEARLRVELHYLEPPTTCDAVDDRSVFFRPYAVTYSVSYYSPAPTDSGGDVFQGSEKVTFLNSGRRRRGN